MKNLDRNIKYNLIDLNNNQLEQVYNWLQQNDTGWELLNTFEKFKDTLIEDEFNSIARSSENSWDWSDNLGSVNASILFLELDKTQIYGFEGMTREQFEVFYNYLKTNHKNWSYSLDNFITDASSSNLYFAHSWLWTDKPHTALTASLFGSDEVVVEETSDLEVFWKEVFLTAMRMGHSYPEVYADEAVNNFKNYFKDETK